MAISNSNPFFLGPHRDPNHHLQSQALHFFIFSLILFKVHSLSFTFPDFQQNNPNLFFEGDSFTSNGVIQLTKNQADGPLTDSSGRASYAQPVRLWDASTQQVTDFTTHFSFRINTLNESLFGDGIAFFIVPYESTIPTNSTGGFLGLFSSDSAFDPSKNQAFGVEFDSKQDDWDPSDNHIGIDVNSIRSIDHLVWNSSMKDNRTANAWITYNSATNNLSVFLTYVKDPIFNGTFSISTFVDLKSLLPERVRIGFSAATGKWFQIHNIISWSFNSTLDDNIGGGEGDKNKNIGLAIGLGVGLGVLICGLSLLGFFWWSKRWSRRMEEDVDDSIDDEFEKGTGPKRFTYRELTQATKNFDEAGKLGEGGFGGVYKGLLTESNTEIAVKRVSRGSRQGKKEYISEVKIISRLRHRNLVQLFGWCHEKCEFLLVYEFMPNGSLDTHLFRGQTMLSWPVRYKIAIGLASSLLYLHEEWEQCVVHRDIKSSNVMLDSNFNAKLGDFGLARFVDHELGSQTTVLAGTMGYLAPECVTDGKASKESDVYSFGVVALEIACGRRPVESRAEPDQVRLCRACVWGECMHAGTSFRVPADKRLGMEFDEQQMEALMVVGLWCCHPDFKLRPSIRQVINVLNFEAPLPVLPAKLPVPMYFAPPMNLCKFSYTSTDMPMDRSQCSCSNCSTYTTQSSGGSSVSLLKSQRHV
ncbi:LOW QUALITY PROTEIN: L-type lectin-domain containing receptor kinase IX.1-like [Benincasa hispida]|uniref:LOW QUALITY PROTEIN: L-type lectin-domain containing receptor kinase IX.1-like n=1 Tax=Benincasa hispida TaxID=102211 RepID=UPI00190040BC|nr:LOW QUALITY PROTEIN: L-type lectin-domain containing receptor kinase IX.1-like [Benincasa hispida]